MLSLCPPHISIISLLLYNDARNLMLYVQCLVMREFCEVLESATYCYHKMLELFYVESCSEKLHKITGKHLRRIIPLIQLQTFIFIQVP